MSADPIQRSEHGGWAGALYAISAGTMWGLFPIYWKWLSRLPSAEILAHRVIWSTALYLAMLAILRRPISRFLSLFLDRKRRWPIIIGSTLLTSNWLLYIWAVNSGHVLETSLGYFMNPLLSVFMGWLILKEKLSRLRWLSVAIAGIGVLLMTYYTGGIPFISLSLAGSFAIYGLIRKQISGDVIEVSAAEASIWVLPALAAAIYFRSPAVATVSPSGLEIALLIGSGLVTGLPLLAFAQATKRLPLSSLGFFQYIGPSLQFLIGAYLYGEPLTPQKLQAFAFIWLALAVYSWDSFMMAKRASRA
jgi:chloramphenicol-sensitive protein RarD